MFLTVVLTMLSLWLWNLRVCLRRGKLVNFWYFRTEGGPYLVEEHLHWEGPDPDAAAFQEIDKVVHNFVIVEIVLEINKFVEGLVRENEV